MLQQFRRCLVGQRRSWYGLLLIGVCACDVHMYQLERDSTSAVNGTDSMMDDIRSDTLGAIENDSGDDGVLSDSTPATDDADVPFEQDLIDDMEDGSGRILARNGRYGIWYVLDDMNFIAWPPHPSRGEPVLMTEIPGGRRDSRWAMRVIGGIDVQTESDEEAAIVGFDLRDDGVAALSFDASSYSGISFWGRSAKKMFVPFRLRSVQETQTGDKGESVDDEYADTIVSIPFNKLWQKIYIFFNFYKKETLPESTPPFEGYWNGVLNLRELLSVQFYFSQQGWLDDFDFWIDDIAFFKGRPDCGLESAVCLFDPQGETDEPSVQ